MVEEKRYCRFHYRCRSTKPEHFEKFECKYLKPCRYGTKCKLEGEERKIHDEYFSHLTEPKPRRKYRKVKVEYTTKCQQGIVADYTDKCRIPVDLENPEEYIIKRLSKDLPKNFHIETLKIVN